MTKVFYLNVSPLKDELVFEKFYNKVLADRKAIVDRYKLKKDKLLSLGGSILLDYAMRVFNIEKENCLVEYGEFGKPSIKGSKNFNFSISHSGDYALLAVSDKKIGADIQEIKEFSENLSNYVLSHSEVKKVSSKEEFFKYFTAKESFAKFDGRGVSIGLKNVETKTENDKNLVYLNGEKQDAQIYFFSLKNYAVSVCLPVSRDNFELIEVVLSQL